MKSKLRNSHWPLVGLFVTPLAFGMALAAPGGPLGRPTGGPPPHPFATAHIRPTHNPNATPAPKGHAAFLLIKSFPQVPAPSF